MKTDTHLINRLNNGSISHDGWMHACPLGEHPWTSADGKETIIQVIDVEAVRLMVNSYPLSVQDSMIDKEHLSMTGDGDTSALGWGKEAADRMDGVWVKCEWTPSGRAVVEGKEYRFNSPCFPRDGLVPLGGNRYRVTKLGRIALTNNPNLRGQTPLTNSRPAANPNPNKPKQMDYKTILLSLLGLPADASDEQITAAVTAMKGKDATMNSRITELQTQLANTDLDAHGIKDETQRKLFTPLLTNAATREDALKTLQQLKPAAAKPPIHNRSGAPTPKTDQELSQAADADKAANDLHNRATAYKHTHKVSYETALAAVRHQPSA